MHKTVVRICIISEDYIIEDFQINMFNQDNLKYFSQRIPELFFVVKSSCVSMSAFFDNEEEMLEISISENSIFPFEYQSRRFLIFFEFSNQSNNIFHNYYVPKYYHVKIGRDVSFQNNSLTDITYNDCSVS